MLAWFGGGTPRPRFENLDLSLVIGLASFAMVTFAVAFAVARFASAKR
jgi:hypothetical protein